MEKLHWLPIQQRIEYKVLLLTYKVLNSLAPVYQSDLLQCRVDWGYTSDNILLLVEPKNKYSDFWRKGILQSSSSTLEQYHT